MKTIEEIAELIGIDTHDIDVGTLSERVFAWVKYVRDEDGQPERCENCRRWRCGDAEVWVVSEDGCDMCPECAEEIEQSV